MSAEQPPDDDPIRHRLYECFDDPDLSLKAKQRRALELGCQALGIATGHVQYQRDDTTHEIVASVGDGPATIPEGVTLDRATTYCRHTIESTSPVAISNAPEEGWADDPAYEEQGQDCYLGATLFVDGDSYGTVCFVSETPHERAFSAGEKALVELIARLIGRAIEAAKHEQRLDETTDATQQSRKKYETLLQLSPDAVIVADAETGEIETANSKTVSLTGYSVAELRGKSVLDLHPDTNREQYAELLGESVDTQITERFDDGTPLYITCADGSTVPIELGVSEVELDDRRIRLGIIRDITERREREQELEHKQALLEQTQAAVDIGSWEVDFDTGISRATEAVFKIFELPSTADLTVESVCDCIHPDVCDSIHPTVRESIATAFERLKTDGEPFDLELRLTNEEDARWVRIVGEPVGAGSQPTSARGIVSDITDRKTRERALRIKDRAIDESTVGITIADATDPNEPIIYANRGFTEITGYSMAETLGRNCRFLQGADSDDETVADIRAAIDNEEPIRTEVLNYRANGTPFWNQLTLTPVQGVESDDVTHFVGIQDDITAQKRRERLIDVLDRVLRHNLRNDMNVIEGFANVIATQTDGDIADMARRIEETATGLISLSETVRDFETEMIQPEPLAPRDVVADVETVVTDLRSTYPDTTFSVVSDESVSVPATHQLQVALRELGDNAAKHADSDVQFEITADGDAVALHVHDSGPGLPQAEHRMLESGRETPLEHGSGLGLWLVNWVVTSLGGDVTAGYDDGTTVTIRLPAVTDEAEDDRRRSAAALSNGIAQPRQD